MPDEMWRGVFPKLERAMDRLTDGGGDQFICAKCQAIVVVPSHAVLSVEQKAALRLGVCRGCLGTREVKEL